MRNRHTVPPQKHSPELPSVPILAQALYNNHLNNSPVIQVAFGGGQNMGGLPVGQSTVSTVLSYPLEKQQMWSHSLGERLVV